MNKVCNRLNIGLGLVIVSLGLGLFYLPIQHEQIAFGGNYSKGSDYNSGPTISTNSSASNPSPTGNSTESMTNSKANSNSIATAKEINGVYRWMNASNSVINPELTFKLDNNNTVQIQNPTDTKHEFVIEFQGKEVATSGDIDPNASGQVSFKPNMTDMLQYHCEYHPDTMKGTIRVSQ